MALTVVRSDLYPPQFSKTFTTFSSDISLHVKSATTGVPVNHLPASLFVCAEAGDIFAYTDALGVANSITFTALYYGTLPFTAATIETETTATSVTVSWNPEP